MEFQPQNIRKLRSDKGLNPVKFADLIRQSGRSITSRTVANWENGKTAPRADELGIMADILDVPISIFFEHITYHSGMENDQT